VVVRLGQRVVEAKRTATGYRWLAAKSQDRLAGLAEVLPQSKTRATTEAPSTAKGITDVLPR
jgi:hypothetical protein